MRQRKGVTYAILLDLGAAVIAFYLAFFLRQSPFAVSYFGSIVYNTTTYIYLSVAALILLVCVLSGYDLYHNDPLRVSARILLVLKAILVWAILTMSLVYIVKITFSRGVFLLAVFLTAVLICCGRILLARYRLGKARQDKIEVIILGSNEAADILKKQLISFFPDLIVHMLNYENALDLSQLASPAPCTVFVADDRLSRENTLAIIARDEFSHHTFRLTADIFKLVTGEITLSELDEIPSIRPFRQPSATHTFLKRFLDIIFSAVAIVVTAPLWILVAIAIRLDSRGPILIKQVRIGQYGMPFTMLKFRTMRVDASLYDYAPEENHDPRVTAVGNILRRLSLDELPQFWNVLKGDMSMVGPRPEMPFIAEKYLPWQRFRLKTKPGITGLWQILGRKDLPLHKNLEYDFYYITHRSFFLDIVIVLKTIPVVIFGRGAY